MKRAQKPAPPLADDPIPAVCFIEDVIRLLRTSRRKIQRLRKYGTFLIKKLPQLDKRPRWSGIEIQKYLQGQRNGVRGRFWPQR